MLKIYIEDHFIGYTYPVTISTDTTGDGHFQVQSYSE